MRTKKQLPIEIVTIEKLVHGGQGIGVLPSGQTCFIWGALASETVKVQLTKRKKNWSEGYAIEVIKPSIDRIQPVEPAMYLATSPWQILQYSKEAVIKQTILQETFFRENINVNWQPFYQQDQSYGYRNKMEYNFWFDTASEQVSLALHKRGSHQKIAVEGSALASEAINTAGKELISYINKNHIQARPLKSVIIRSSADGRVGMSLFVNDASIAKRFTNFAGNNIVFEVVFSDPKSPASIATKVLIPPAIQLSDTLLGNTYSYSTRSFFQGNVPTYEKALQIIFDIVQSTPQKHVIDLYSGVGSIGLSVTPKTKKLTLIEVDAESLDMAKQNIGVRQNVELVCATAESVTEYITSDALIIVDPPRSGLHKNVLERLIECRPATILYLSCNPSTQARDISALLPAGYSIHYGQGFNFFPRTPHIESLIVLTKQ